MCLCSPSSRSYNLVPSEGSHVSDVKFTPPTKRILEVSVPETYMNLYQIFDARKTGAIFFSECRRHYARLSHGQIHKFSVMSTLFSRYVVYQEESSNEEPSAFYRFNAQNDRLYLSPVHTGDYSRNCRRQSPNIVASVVRA